MAIFKFFDECVHTRIGRGLVWPLLSRKHFFITVDLLLIDAAFYDFAIFWEITFPIWLILLILKFICIWLEDKLYEPEYPANRSQGNNAEWIRQQEDDLQRRRKMHAGLNGCGLLPGGRTYAKTEYDPIEKRMVTRIYRVPF